MTGSTIGTTLDSTVVQSFRDDGFVHIPQVLTPAEISKYHKAVKGVYDSADGMGPTESVFTQVVNVWHTDPVLRELTFHDRLARLATELAGIDLRIWHDQLLAKKPRNGAPTGFHQDAPYWPHAGARQSLSAWIALVDVPVERGCMSFIAGQHTRDDIRPIDLHDEADLFEAAPDLIYTPRVTIPLRAGDVTFHHGFTPHAANANDTDEVRFAYVNIYVDRSATYTGEPHVCTDALNLTVGDVLPDEHFPEVPTSN